MSDIPPTIQDRDTESRLLAHLVALAEVCTDLTRALKWLEAQWTPDLPLPSVEGSYDLGAETQLRLGVHCSTDLMLEAVKARLTEYGANGVEVEDRFFTYPNGGRYRYVTRRWGSVFVQAWRRISPDPVLPELGGD